MVALVLVICGVILVVVILKSLPSAKEIGHALNLTKNKTVKTQVVSQTQIATAEIPAASHTELLEVVSGTEVAAGSRSRDCAKT